MLLEAGASPNVLAASEIARVRPLGTAAFVRSVPLARLLLDHGAGVNDTGESGFTALHAAAQNGDEEFARLLLDHGADRSLAADNGQRPADLGLPELLVLRREILDTRFQYLDALLEAALARIDLDASAALLR